MREIKFRAKVLGRDQWVYGHYFMSPLTDENSGEPPENGWYFLSGPTAKAHHCIEQNGVAFTIDPETIGQLTGMHSIDGKEIYEGDKVTFDIVADYGQPEIKNLWGYVCWEYSGWAISAWGATWARNIRIIGNYFDEAKE